jgi:nitrate/nitrite transporter NarK
VAILLRARTGATGIVAGVGGFVTVGAAYVLGRLVAWDGLGLHAVVRDVAGVDGALDPSVFVVSVDGRTVSPSTYRWWAVAHLVLSALAVLSLVMLWLRTRDREVSRRRSSPTPVPEPPG